MAPKPNGSTPGGALPSGDGPTAPAGPAPAPASPTSPGNHVVVSSDGLVEAGRKCTIPGQTIETAYKKWRSGLDPLGEPWGGPNDEVGKEFGPNYRENEAATSEVLTALYEGMFALEGNFNVMAKNFNNAEDRNSR